MTVYLLHSDTVIPRGGTRGVNHYLGHCAEGEDALWERVNTHRYGGPHAAKIANEFRRRNADIQLVYVESGAGHDREHQLKRNKHFGRRLCPICRLIEPVLDAIEGKRA